uniref:Large ribosomal subunit protein uL24c n=1 Tax=Kapraunia schneideri TaxID=717899 RepID=A0A1Z1MS81_9FLOR|nr:ribosomal protein L24 [Kapraunia schneideri]ARW68963.1 ribosomal protein L24 [Kapraunia schneideri]
MQIKEGDQVLVISGKEKGRQGKVVSLDKKRSKIIIENLNMKVKHVKPKNNNNKGYIKKIEGPIHQSNVKIYNVKK